MYPRVNGSIIYNSQKLEATQVTTDVGTMRTVEYYLTLRRKEILTHVTLRMNFEDIM